MGCVQKGGGTVSASHVETEAKTEQSTESRIGGESGESTSGQGSEACGSCEAEICRHKKGRCQKGGGEDGTGKGGEEGCASQEDGGEGEEGDGTHRDRGADSLIVLLVGFRSDPAFEDSVETWLDPGPSLY